MNNDKIVKVGFVKTTEYPKQEEVAKYLKVKPIWSFAHSADACVDIYAARTTILEPGETKIVPTGVKLILPKNYELQIRPRSGMSSKGILTQLGTVDENYRGEIGVIVYNSTNDAFIVHKGERIGQGAVRPIPAVEFVEATEDDLTETDRGENGFGSSGR